MMGLIYVAAAVFFISDYLKDKEKYKLAALPLLLVSYQSAAGMYNDTDSRLVIFIYILTFLSTAYYVNTYWQHYKLDRFHQKLAQREQEHEE